MNHKWGNNTVNPLTGRKDDSIRQIVFNKVSLVNVKVFGSAQTRTEVVFISSGILCQYSTFVQRPRHPIEDCQFGLIVYVEVSPVW